MTTEIVIPKGEHSPLGPSSSKRWINCPGSVSASVGAPDDESVFAAEGTAAHYLSELARKENRPCIHWLETVLVSGKYKFTVDEEMAASAQEFVDWCEEIGGVQLVEQRIDYSEDMPESTIAEFGPAFGTLDDARLRDGVIPIIDFKHGKGVQEFAEWNTQLLLQALGVYRSFGHLFEIKGFLLGICQPRLDHKDTWEISTEDLLKWAKRLVGYGTAVEMGLEFKAGSHCQFCRIRKKCAVRANQLTSLMLEEGEFEDLDNLEVHAMRAQNRLQHLTNEQIAKILPALGDFTKWIKDVQSRAISALIAKESVGGWKLVAGRSNRKVKDEKTWAEKLTSLEINPWKPAKVISPAEAEAELGKAEFARRFKLDEDFTKPQGKPKLAPADDKRKAIDTSSVNEFDDLDAE